MIINSTRNDTIWFLVHGISTEQGSTLTFQLTSLVVSDNLDFTSQNNFSLAKGPTHRQKDVPSRYTPSE